MRHLILLALTLSVMVSPELEAQTASQSLQGRDRVRIVSDGAVGEFSVVEVRPDALVLRSDSVSTALHVPMASVTKLEVSRPRGRGATALKGALVGGAFGGVLAPLLAKIEIPVLGNTETGSKSCYDTCNVGKSTTQVALIGLGMGAGLGTLFALVFAGREHWQDVPMVEQLGITPSGYGGIAFSYAYKF